MDVMNVMDVMITSLCEGLVASVLNPAEQLPSLHTDTWRHMETTWRHRKSQ